MKEAVQIFIDIHERDSGLLEVIQGRGLQAEEKHLESGDVVIYHSGKTVALELKRGTDLTNSLHSSRLSQQLVVMMDTYDFPILLLESWKCHFGDNDDEDSMAVKIWKTKMAIRTINRKLTVYETDGMTESVDIIEEIVRDMLAGKLFVIRRPITVEPEVSDSMRILCSLSNVSRERAETLLDKYQTPQNALKHLSEWPELKMGLTQIRCESIRQAYSGDGMKIGFK